MPIIPSEYLYFPTKNGKCLYRKNKPCQENLIQDTFDLINRLQAENERLQLLFESVINSRDGYIKVIEQYKAENERLKEDIGKEFICFVGDPHKVEHCPYLEQVETARAEAYKEFAEAIFELFPNDKPNTVISRVTVKHILKELVGDDYG